MSDTADYSGFRLQLIPNPHPNTRTRGMATGMRLNAILKNWPDLQIALSLAFRLIYEPKTKKIGILADEIPLTRKWNDFAKHQWQICP
jgi:hypothetical protein